MESQIARVLRMAPCSRLPLKTSEFSQRMDAELYGKHKDGGVRATARSGLWQNLFGPLGLRTFWCSVRTSFIISGTSRSVSSLPLYFTVLRQQRRPKVPLVALLSVFPGLDSAESTAVRRNMTQMCSLASSTVLGPPMWSMFVLVISLRMRTSVLHGWLHVAAIETAVFKHTSWFPNGQFQHHHSGPLAEEQCDRWKHRTLCNEIDLTGSVGLDGMQVDNILPARLATTDTCFRASGLQTLCQLQFCLRQ